MPFHLPIAQSLCATLGFLVLSLGATPVDGQYPPPTAPAIAWEDLLSGKLEDHWADMNCAVHSPTFELRADPDNAQGHLLALTRSPTGLIRTHKQYENFILECDWRHLTEAPNAGGTPETTGNSGLYVWSDPLPTVGGPFARAIEVQVCNLGNGRGYTSHGDLFPIWGAKMIPDPRFNVSGSRSRPIEFRAKKTGEWNHIRVTCVDGTIQEEVNGALVSSGFRASPRKGYFCVESEGGPVEFRKMRIHELPGDPSLKAEDTAQVLPEGSKTYCLYNGVDLQGWTAGDGQKAEWKADDHELVCAGKTAGVGLELRLPEQAGGNKNFMLIVDFDDTQGLPFDLVGMGGPVLKEPAAKPAERKGWSRAVFTCSDRVVTLTVNGQKISETGFDLAGLAWPTLQLKNPGRLVHFSNLILMESPAKK